eukprot:8124893-Karenia_brevis.AAC.1
MSSEVVSQILPPRFDSPLPETCHAGAFTEIFTHLNILPSLRLLRLGMCAPCSCLSRLHSLISPK